MILLYPLDQAHASRRIERTWEAYKTLFQHESILRADSRAWVSFSANQNEPERCCGHALQGCERAVSDGPDAVGRDRRGLQAKGGAYRARRNGATRHIGDGLRSFQKG